MVYTKTIILGIIISLATSAYADEKISVNFNEGKTEIILIEGSAKVIRNGSKTSHILKRGDCLSPGDKLSTEKKSRIEFRLPYGSCIRLDERTTVELISALSDSENNGRTIDLKIWGGKLWAHVSKVISGKGKFSISTKTAISGVRGTIYRINANKDDSATIKVYEGEVSVSSAKKSKKIISKEWKIEQPVPIEGPHPISGPHPVSVEEWDYILKSMQQIDISPDGIASKPFTFLPESDEDEWVRWNKKRDNKYHR